MYAKINDNIIENIEWDGDLFSGFGTLSIFTEAPFSDIISLFETEGTLEIRSNEDALICIWYNTKLRGIEETIENERRKVNINLKVIPITEDLSTTLQSALAEEENAILELASAVDEVVRYKRETSQTINDLQETANILNSNINALAEQFNALADRVAILENRGV